MFFIHLPIAEMTVTAESIFLLSLFVGFLSGVFGVGGGFMTTPFLIFSGIPPAVAVGTQACQLVASSCSGALGHWRKNNVDIKMGLVLLGGGAFGSLVGIVIFNIMSYLGKIDFFISLLYVLLLGFIGGLMLLETALTLYRKHKGISYTPKTLRDQKMPSFLVNLPYKMRFPQSRLYISAVIPAAIGFVGGVLASVLGIGGGFLMVPAMIYILGMPSLLVAGTALFQVVFTTAFAAMLHASTNTTVDIMLAAILIAGAVIGAQFGVALGRHIQGAHGRVVLAILILVVAGRMALDLFIMPGDLYSTVEWGAP